MENNDQRPGAALINREWYDAAFSVLSSESLGRVLMAACEYVFQGEHRVNLSQGERIVFAMIKPALDSDIIKYRERCARNAANAKSQWQRVAASGSDSQRVAANTTSTTTTTTTSTSISLRDRDPEKEIEVEKWLVFGYFWCTGSKAIREECNAFWAYYESLGWKNNKGAPIVSKLAAARMWRRQFETGDAPAGADAWFNALKSCTIPDYNAWLCYAGAERNEAGALVNLRCKRSFWESLRSTVPTIEKSLQRAWKVPAVVFKTID